MASVTEKSAVRIRSRLAWREHATGWALAAPFALLFAVFMLVPIVASMLLSFTDFGVGNLQDPSSAALVGLQNYAQVLKDEQFRAAALNTALIVAVAMPLTLSIGLLLAVAMDKGITKLRTLFRIGYYLPVITTIVAIAVTWRYILDTDYGVINNLLSMVGIEGPSWLSNPTLALPTIIALVVWRNIGNAMVIFLAALQGIDHQLYDAAKVDGAGPIGIFRYITVPLLRPATLLLAVYTTAGYVGVFDEPFVLTGGGPLNKTLTVTMFAYEQGFKFFKLGYASSITFILFVAIAVLTVIQFRLLRPQA